MFELLLSFTSFIVTIMFMAIIIGFFENNLKGWIVAGVLAGLWFSVSNFKRVDVELPDKTYERVFVSAVPDKSLEGEISGNFLIFSGSFGQRRFYILREEIEEGLYKDFIVKEEVYLREDDTLTNKGKFVQVFSREQLVFTYSLFGIVVSSSEGIIKEDYVSQTIVLPKGYIEKNITKI